MNVTATTERELLKPTEAADYLRTTVTTLATWRCTGRHGIPFIKRGRSVLYRRKDLDAFLERGERVHT